VKPRAKFETKSLCDRVAEYDGKHPGKLSQECADALRIRVDQVYGARCANKRKAGKVPQAKSGEAEVPLLEKDIIAISRMGAAAAERIIKLLKAMAS
jgi:hypothetical protein